MSARAATLVACSAALLLAACGSSSTPSTAASTPVPSTATSATAPAGAQGLKVAGTPRFATPPASEPVQSGTVQVAYRNIAIEPDTLRVKVGSTIRWTNYDSVQHNVTAEGGPLKFASKDFGEGGTFEVTVRQPGVIHYESTTQPATMNGTIEVVR